jgi:hypothetical protein
LFSGDYGYQILVPQGATRLEVRLTTATLNADLDLYVRFGADIDLAGGSPFILPDLDPSTTSTPRLISFGGKQGNQYLVDRDRMPGSLISRPACGINPAADLSLLPPDAQPQFGSRGPLNVFGPYTDTYGNGEFAKGRSTGAFFRAADGNKYVFVTGTSKDARTEALRLVEAAGLTGWDAGPIENSVVIEGLTSVLININKQYGSTHAGIKVTGAKQKS